MAGIEVEWGYFSLEKLQELGATRLVIERFPKQFKELIIPEISNNMTPYEVKSNFGELKDPKYQKQYKEFIKRYNDNNMLD